MKTLVSVIVPAYNAEGTLRKCVESLVFGIEKRTEIILVDDCSKDRSWDLCRKLADEFSNVRCVQNEKNSGVSHTRNHGLDEAQGEYVMFVDSDDWVSQHYISKMLDAATIHHDMLPICGFQYMDRLRFSKTAYCWDNENKTKQLTVDKRSFFRAVDRIMLQNVWNKIFRKDIIRAHHLRFDESQSMGEDFGFVLDYMEAAGIERCLMLNEPLYYYVRANRSSLMSHFGWTTDEKGQQRYEQLARICGNTEEAQGQLQRQMDQSKANAVYFVARTKEKTKAERLARIEQIMVDGRALEHYCREMRQYRKEQAVALVTEGKRFVNRVRGKIQRARRGVIIWNMRRRVHAKDISIISQNCIGGVFYHDLGMQFLSPTINLYFTQPDFVRFVLNLEHYLSVDMQMEWAGEYPIGRLEDVAVHFEHYSTCSEAKESWNRRKTRVNLERILVLSTDMEGFNDAAYEEWKRIRYPKVLFTAHEEYVRDGNGVYYPRYAEDGQVGYLIPDRDFYAKSVLLDTVNRNWGI